MSGEIDTMSSRDLSQGSSPPRSPKRQTISPPPPPSEGADSKVSEDSNTHQHQQQPVVFEWLKRIGLSDCIDAFKARSVDTPQVIIFRWD